MRTAIDARASTPRQERDQTIESQLATLRSWTRAHGDEFLPEHEFIDEGYSGARLDRPALDRLRDAIADAVIDQLLVLTPDRLARKHAYQVLLLEEFRRAGCAVVFLQRPISDDPNDQLLLQIQGAVAEYERAVLAERFRRGKLQNARSGNYNGGKAPHGYHYIRKREGVPGHLVVNDAEAEMVRQVYGWLIEERMTIRQILKRLNAGPWPPRSQSGQWSSSVVHHILSDPIRRGIAYSNRYQFVPPKKPRKRGPASRENSCRKPKPENEWIAIPVPAIVGPETFDLAQAQLARNSALSFRYNTKHSYLLRCLLSCELCGLAMFGGTNRGPDGRERRYYLCHGRDARDLRPRLRRVAVRERRRELRHLHYRGAPDRGCHQNLRVSHDTDLVSLRAGVRETVDTQNRRARPGVFLLRGVQDSRGNLVRTRRPWRGPD